MFPQKQKKNKIHKQFSLLIMRKKERERERKRRKKRNKHNKKNVWYITNPL